MNLKEIMAGLKYEVISGNIDNNININNITIDSRKAENECVFLCINGLSVDGHSFIESAVNRGCKVIVVEKDVMQKDDSVVLIKVENTREALSVMSANFYGNPSKHLNLIGVTGTNGKTSTTYFIQAILNADERKVGVIGTMGAKIDDRTVDIPFSTSTTPDPMELHAIFNEMKNDGVDDLVMEVSSHALELKKVDNCHFNIGVFTNLTQDHLDLHETMENYGKAKAKLFALSDTSIINVDDEYAQLMKNSGAGKVITFGVDCDCDYKAINVEYSPNGVAFEVLINGNLENFNVPVAGKFTVYNVLGAILACLESGVPVETVKEAVRNIKGVPGRIQRIENDKELNVFVDYAHTPDGIENILLAVRAITTGRIITVFGCGGDRDRTKRPIMGKIAGTLSDVCIITSDNPRTENPDSIIEEIEIGFKHTPCDYYKTTDRRDAIHQAISLAMPGDAIIIAGKGHEDYQIFKTETIHFDDCEVAKEALEALK